MAGTATPALPQNADDLGFVPVGQQGGNQQASSQDDDLGFVPANQGPAPAPVQPYAMPNGRLIDPMTHTGGVPNPHAAPPAPPPQQDTIQAAPPQTWFDRARGYVANSTPGQTLHAVAPGVSEALGIAPTESETAQQQRMADAGIYKPVTAVKQIGAGLENIGESGAFSGMTPGGGVLPTPPELKTQVPRQVDLSRAAKGATQVMGGTMELAKPVMPVAIAEAPISAAIYYGAGILAGKGSAAVAQQMGATPDEVNFFNTLGFFIPGVLTGLAAVKSASIPEGATVRDPVTGAEVPVRGGVVGGKGFAAGVARSDTGGYAGQVRVGPFSAKVRFGRNIPDEAPAAPSAPAGLPQGQVLPPEPQAQPSPVALQQQSTAGHD